MKKIYTLLLSLIITIPVFAIGPITGTYNVCAGSTTTLSDTSLGGIWTSGSTLIATVDSFSGVVTGVSSGTTIIFYTVGGSFVNATIVVYPAAGIVGLSEVCVGATITLTGTGGSTLGGTWSESSPLYAILVPGGEVTGLSPGIDTIFYTASTGCSAKHPITVNPAPPAPTIAGTTTYCACESFTGFTLTISTGATVLWYPSSLGGIGSTSTPVINTCIPGTYSEYASQMVGTCESYRTGITVTVNPTPIPITATATPNPVCLGDTLTISGTSTGGTLFSWVGPGGFTSPVSTTMLIATYSNSGVYYFTATNSFGCHASANTANVVVDSCPVRANSIMVNSEIEMYPNPTNGKLYLDLGAAPVKPNEIKISDMLGRELINLSIIYQKTVINLDELNAGTYFVSIKTNNGYKYKKIQINR